MDGYSYLACTPGKRAADAYFLQVATLAFSIWLFSSGMLNSSLSSLELSFYAFYLWRKRLTCAVSVFLYSSCYLLTTELLPLRYGALNCLLYLETEADWRLRWDESGDMGRDSVRGSGSGSCMSPMMSSTLCATFGKYSFSLSIG